MSIEKIPTWLKHQPIIGVDYSKKDAMAGDAKFLSIGKSTWDSEDISAKVWRWSDDGEKWSRQSEELPLWRVLDLAKLLIAVIKGKTSSLGEEIISDSDKEFLCSFINENMELYAPRMSELKSLLEDSDNHSNEKVPNIFSFATSELSQDAMFAWLIKWADDSYMGEDSNLCKLGKKFVSLMTDIPFDNIHKINVGRQWQNIDIWVEINDDSFLVIEDKTGTSIHDNQLKRYKEIAEEEYKGLRNVYCAYVKTENEPLSILKIVKAHGYKEISRHNMLSLFADYKGGNPLVMDYRNHLQSLEDATNDFLNKPVKDWGWYQWQGFYKELENHIQDVDWNYVANPAGGFLGLWWNFIENDEVQMYLQFEEAKLCIKIMYDGNGDRSSVRWKYHEKLLREAKDADLAIEKPARFGAGTYMTIGVVPAEFIFGQGIIDMNALVSKLRQLESLVKKCME